MATSPTPTATLTETVAAFVPADVWGEVVSFYTRLFGFKPEEGPGTATFKFSEYYLQLTVEGAQPLEHSTTVSQVTNSVFVQVQTVDAVSKVFNDLPKNPNSKQPPQSILILPSGSNTQTITYTLASACYKYKNAQFAQSELRMGVIHNPPY